MSTEEERDRAYLADADVKLLAEARALPARDAFVLLRTKIGHTRLKLDDVAPDASEADRESANRLIGDAYGYGDRYLSFQGLPERKAVHEEIRAQMRKEHPGFLDQTYEIAFSHGCFEAMW